MSACVGGGQGQQPGLDERTRIRLSSSTSVVVCRRLSSSSPQNSNLLEVRISGRGADRCDQDDEIYLMVQEIWSGSLVSGLKMSGDAKPCIEKTIALPDRTHGSMLFTRFADIRP